MTTFQVSLIRDGFMAFTADRDRHPGLAVHDIPRQETRPWPRYSRLPKVGDLVEAAQQPRDVLVGDSLPSGVDLALHDLEQVLVDHRAGALVEVQEATKVVSRVSHPVEGHLDQVLRIADDPAPLCRSALRPLELLLQNAAHLGVLYEVVDILGQLREEALHVLHGVDCDAGRHSLEGGLPGGSKQQPLLHTLSLVAEVLGELAGLLRHHVYLLWCSRQV